MCVCVCVHNRVHNVLHCSLYTQQCMQSDYCPYTQHADCFIRWAANYYPYLISTTPVLAGAVQVTLTRVLSILLVWVTCVGECSLKYFAARLADKLHNLQLTVESWPESPQFSVCAKPPDWVISKDPMRLVPSAASRAWIKKPRNTSPIAIRDTAHTRATHNISSKSKLEN